MKYIFLASRAASYALDYIILYIISTFFSSYGVIGYIISLILFFLYRYLGTALFGATLGMMILKLRLDKYNFRICFKREVYRAASAFFYIGYLYAFIDASGRTLHDAVSDTFVVYSGNREIKKNTPGYLHIIAFVILIISSVRWISYFIINDIGLVGLKRVYQSDEYFQSFEGDKLISLSQDELYMKTLGRKYTALVDIDGKPAIVRISNKLKYTEVYRLNLIKPRIVGEYIYKINLPLQFICSGIFNNKRDLCGLSPQNDIVIVNEKGDVYGKGKSDIINILTLKCGDIDNDGTDEGVVLGRGGDVEVYKFSEGLLKRVYSGKFGEDIMPETLYIDGGAAVVSKYDDKKILYFYDYRDNKFIFKDKKYFNTNAVSGISKTDNLIITSHVNRNAMTFKRGSIQRLEAYIIGRKIKKVYDFGVRPGRRYAYMVRTLEEVFDLDGDGRDEIVLKAVGKEDVMGQGYRVEIYKFNRAALWANRILYGIEDILFY